MFSAAFERDPAEQDEGKSQQLIGGVELLTFSQCRQARALDWPAGENDQGMGEERRAERREEKSH